MTILRRLKRLNPLPIARAADAVPRLETAATRLREDQKAMVRQLRTLSRQVADLQETINRQQEILASLPSIEARLQRGEARIEQCVTAYTKDARSAEWVSALQQRLDAGRVGRHAAAAVREARLDMDPGAHVVIDNLLPEDFAEELVKAVPPSLFFATQNVKRQELAVPFFFAPEYNRVVWAFFHAVLRDAILPATVEKFRPALDDFIGRHWPRLGTLAASGIQLGLVNSRIMLRRPGYCIAPHRDPRWAFLTCLVYLQHRDDRQPYGTQFYRLREEREPTHHSPLWLSQEEVLLVKDVEARHNRAVVFLNSTGAHGAFIPADAPPETERFIYQVQFGPDEKAKERLIAELDGAARTSWTTARGGY